MYAIRSYYAAVHAAAAIAEAAFQILKLKDTVGKADFMLKKLVFSSFMICI